jgi:hypothetical protein
LAGKNKANPVKRDSGGGDDVGSLGESTAKDRIVGAVEAVCKGKKVWIDSDGCPVEGTRAVAEAVCDVIKET